VSALQVLLMGHAMEKKHGALEAKYKDAAENVEKWKHKVTGMQARLKNALNDKKAAKNEVGEMKEAKEVVELETDSFKKKVGELEGELVAANIVVEEGRGRPPCILTMALNVPKNMFFI